MQETIRHQSRLRGLLRCMLFDQKDPDDVWQETNLLLIRKAEDFKPGTDFWAWASTIARYQVLTYADRCRRDRLVFDGDLIEQLARSAEQRLPADSSRRDALADCVGQLSPPQRRLIELHYGTGMSLSQMSETLDRPLGSIRQTLYRIRCALQECVARRVE